ncbi:MAG: serine hydrolase [Chitinophagaceae bacterium]|nr:serine hydrolase [Chitinophagaceae bacterium]MCW5904169.1 serine hydrolase [Chitinophagaceae bacterium]
MKPIFILLISIFIFSKPINAQQFSEQTPEALHWADSVFATLTPQQKIAQLMIIRAHSNLGEEHIQYITNLIKEYNIGGLCFFQGSPVKQANLTNYYQKIAQTPLMICIDGEWGLAMRLDSVINFPRQLMIGAVPDAALVYQFGKAVGEQCKRLGIHVNYAPVVDVNNNPNNPVINDRSFGEDKYKVALYGIQYMKGIQDVGVMACAKHFPGHGDVSVDSHYDLPVINKSRQQLDSLELYPFKELIKAGVGSMMIAHLYIPAIDSTKNLATSLSKKNVTFLLKNELDFKGITFTDGLEMQGVKKLFPDDEVNVQSLIAGNDMLCLPENVSNSIHKIIEAINNGRLSWSSIDESVKKVLIAKYHLGLNNLQEIDTENLVNDLNKTTNQLRQKISEQSLTLLQLSNENLLPIKHKKKVAYVGIGLQQTNSFARAVKEQYNAKIFLRNYKDSSSLTDLKKQLLKYKIIIVGVHNYSRRPNNNFGINDSAVSLIQYLAEKENTIIVDFGNPYAIKNFCGAKNLIACYEDDSITHQAAINLLKGNITAKGKLPVTVCDNFKFGDGITYHYYMPFTTPETENVYSTKLAVIDSIATNALAQNATQGMEILVARNGKIIYQKSFGYTDTTHVQTVTNNTVYDLASITKVAATTIAIMKLYEEHKIDVDKTVGDYLTWTKGTNKATLKISNLLLHQSGLVPYISFYKQVTDTTIGKPLAQYFNSTQNKNFPYRVAENLFLKNDYQSKMLDTIASSELERQNEYVYSDNNFILLGLIVEAISGKTLDNYVRENFYQPLQMTSTTFKPREHYTLQNIAPTELDTYFRKQLIYGDVHDEGAAMFGGVAGHAGLFSNAYDLAQLFQMLLNGGELNGKRYLQKKTIQLFTAYNSNISRRGFGFDKPEKNNATLSQPYPCKYASSKTFGHTGFTGTCIWADPSEKLIYIFLTNRVHPTRKNILLNTEHIRNKIQDAVYNALNIDK